MNDDALRLAREVLDNHDIRFEVSRSGESEHQRIAEVLQQCATSRQLDSNDFDVLVALAADFLRRNDSMPSWLAEFAADVLSGSVVRPTKRGPDKYANFERDFKLWRAVTTVADRHGMPRHTHNELSKKGTAAELVSIASGMPIDVVIKAIRRFSPPGAK